MVKFVRKLNLIQNFTWFWSKFIKLCRKKYLKSLKRAWLSVLYFYTSFIKIEWVFCQTEAGVGLKTAYWRSWRFGCGTSMTNPHYPPIVPSKLSAWSLFLPSTFLLLRVFSQLSNDFTWDLRYLCKCGSHSYILSVCQLM